LSPFLSSEGGWMMGENESRCPLIRFVHHYLMLVSFMCVLCL